jgi:hypothetical protein
MSASAVLRQKLTPVAERGLNHMARFVIHHAGRRAIWPVPASSVRQG